MITQPTVLILGAGASAPYGFPSGRELLTHICEELSSTHHMSLRKLLKDGGVKAGEIDSFRQELYHSQQDSVDAFLEHRPEFLKVGKLAIAASLAPNEDENWLLRIEDRDTSFYQYLFSKMSTRFEDFHENKLSIVTFNYDRSIEHYLFSALKHTHGRSDKECAEVMNRIRIIHVHGRLGALPWQSHDGRPYVGSIGPYGIREVAKQIMVIPESEGTSEEFEKASELLQAADNVFFLGFGYNDVNLTRLKLHKLPDSLRREVTEYTGKPRLTGMVGSSLGLEQAETKVIMEKWKISLPDSHCDCLQFLRRYVGLY